MSDDFTNRLLWGSSKPVVHVVTCTDGKSTWIETVFTTREGAEQYIRQEQAFDAADPATTESLFTYSVEGRRLRGETNAEGP